jgi:fatty acid desaturase
MHRFFTRRADELEEILNTVNDRDGQWWPFVFLRPEPDARMTSGRVAALALLLGFFFGMLANVAVALTATPSARPHVLVFPLFTAFGFFALFRMTFAYSWNRRAERLRARSDAE